jgi:hypothetical protein
MIEALRFVKRPENGRIIIDLPQKLKSQKKVEVIILPLNLETKTKKDFDPKEYKGIWKNNDIDVEKMCKEMRDEWERDF